MTNHNIPNNFSFMKYALKAIPGVADVGDPHGAHNIMHPCTDATMDKSKR